MEGGGWRVEVGRALMKHRGWISQALLTRLCVAFHRSFRTFSQSTAIPFHLSSQICLPPSFRLLTVSLPLNRKDSRMHAHHSPPHIRVASINPHPRPGSLSELPRVACPPPKGHLRRGGVPNICSPLAAGGEAHEEGHGAQGSGRR